MTQKILLIEDDPLIVEIYTTKLKQAGLEVEVAGDGEEGLRMLKKGKYDLVILDLVLPRLSGFELLSKVQKSPNLRKVKILILSNLGQKSEVRKGIRFGAVRYLIKAHYTPTEVVEEIKKLLK